ncbi:MAG: NosD domain-containing protein [Nanoarchaeota archaeon]|nr:NosD domain-containing protein [Nanoarchaeota archaeon]
MKRFFIGILLLITLFFLNYAVEFDSCQILNSGSYELNESILSSGSNCIEITGNNIILDCQGFNISGTGSNYGIYITGNNSQVLNCNINNFNRGIYFYSQNNYLYNSSVNGSIYGYYLGSNSHNQTLILNKATSNVVAGIYLSFTSHNNTLFSNIINDSSTGITINSDTNIIFENNISNSNTGISLSQGNSNNISSNIIQNNYNRGIHVSGSSANNNRFVSNIISENNQGIYLNAIEDNIFTSNTIISNINENIYFYSFSGGPYTNLFYNNTLGNISKISSSNWANWENQFNLSTQGNIYFNSSGLGSGIIHCFSINNCDNYAEILYFPSLNQISEDVSSLFPFHTPFYLLSILFFYFLSN